MQRTKKGRNVPPFSLRSGTATPYPFLRGVGKFFQKAVNTSPIGMGINALTGNKDAETFGGIGQKIMGGGDSGDTSTKIDELHSRITTNTKEIMTAAANQHAAQNKEIQKIRDELISRVGVLEKWRHVLIGGSIVVGFMLHKFMNFGS